MGPLDSALCWNSQVLSENLWKVGGFYRTQSGSSQEDPLSPYLFILCAEGPSALVEKRVRNGTVHGFRVCRRAPSFSRLLCADDSVFFFKASVEECNNMKLPFEEFENASGQAINYSKSGIFFSCNRSIEQRHLVMQNLGVSQDLKHDQVPKAHVTNWPQ